MPSSSNRKRIEIPSDLFDHLASQAEQHGVPVSALATFLLLEALNGPQLHPTLEQRLDEILASVRDIRAATSERNDTVRSSRDELGETREYMLLRFPEGATDILTRHQRDEKRLRTSRQRLIDQLRTERSHEAPTGDVAEIRRGESEHGDEEDGQ